MTRATQVFESEEEFNVRMLSHNAHADAGGAQPPRDATAAGGEAAREAVHVVPTTHTDTADFCLRADQDRHNKQPPPHLAPRDTFEVRLSLPLS
jgi:hypothetical protein